MTEDKSPSPGRETAGPASAAAAAPTPSADQPVPRLPRGRGIRLTGPEVVRIAMFLAVLVGVLALRQPCADGVSGFIGQFEPDAGVAPGPAPGAQPPAPLPGELDETRFIRLHGGMTEDEIRQKLDQAGVDAADAGPAGTVEP